MFTKGELLLFFVLSFCCFKVSESKSLPNTPVRSDVVVTSGSTSNNNFFYKGAAGQDEIDIKPDEPGWFKRQLLRFGEMTSTVGNRLGAFSSRLAGALDKICEVVKTIIPVIAAVCHVGQFQFCDPINEAPQELAEALAPNNLDLSILD